MTRLEKYLEMARENTLVEKCSKYEFNLDFEREKQEFDSENGIIIGCNGITCRDCWNMEYEEGTR